jgi:adenine-specific DNA-methyltransferase
MPAPETAGVKYIGSKNKLIDAILGTITPLAPTPEQHALIDVFTGTTRVAQAFRAKGWQVTTCDLAWASHDYAALFLQTTRHDLPELRALAAELDALIPPHHTPGWIESNYSDAPAAAAGGATVRVWQAHNARKADAIRDTIAEWVAAGRVKPVMARALTALLILALDSVDNTVGVQQAYLKQWCTRSFNTMNLSTHIPADDWAGWDGPPAQHLQGDALAVPFADAHVAYVDPPYTGHSYATYYHIWDSISRWDKPGVLLKTNRRADRVAAHDGRDLTMVSPWNARRGALDAFVRLVRRLPTRWVVISYSSDAIVPIKSLTAEIEKLDVCGSCRVHGIDHARNVMANIGNGADADNRSRVTEYIIVVEKT